LCPLLKNKNNINETNAIAHPFGPTITLNEAIKKDASKWLKAFVSELQSLKDTYTYRIVDTLSERKVIVSRRVLRKKFNYLGRLARRKA
jgi:hypothetical protein